MKSDWGPSRPDMQPKRLQVYYTTFGGFGGHIYTRLNGGMDINPCSDLYLHRMSYLHSFGLSWTPCLCVYIYMYVYISLCICVYLHTQTHTYTYSCTFTVSFTFTFTYTNFKYINICIYKHTYTYKCIHVCIYIHIHTHTSYIQHTYIHTYIHAYIHIYIYAHMYLHSCMYILWGCKPMAISPARFS